MNKLSLIGFLLACHLWVFSTTCFAQQKISNLIFNSTDNITGLQFKEHGAPTVFYTGQRANATIGEGIAHAENEEGEIIFWVSSSGVYDKNHQLMPGSEGIYAHPSATEITICPFPDNPSKYYIFYNNQLCSGLYYSVVDMSARDGIGDIDQLNIPVLPEVDFAEGLEIIRIPCSRDYWLIATECGKGLRRFKIGQEGISGGEMSGVYTNDFGGRGELDYHKGRIGLALTFRNEAYFVDFDPQSGEFSNYHLVNFSSRNGAYGLEFSPDGTKVYITDISNRDIFGNPAGSNLFAFDFTRREFQSWMISNNNPDCSSQMEGLGHIELGKDGNLYISQINGCQIVVVVENPDSDQPVIRKIDVNSILSAGISDHIQTDFLDEGLVLNSSILVDGEPFLCLGEEKVLFAEEQVEETRYQWFKDGAELSGEQGVSLTTKEPGVYTLSFSNDAGCSSLSNEIILADKNIPPLEYQEKYSGCAGEAIVLSLGIEDFQVTWSNGATGSSMSVEEAGTYGFTVANEYCTQSGSIEVILQEKSLLKIPNVISPNGDAYNEHFIVSGITEKIALFVYNRWGKLVYYAADYQNNWKGEGLSKGNYYYKIQPHSPCSEQRKGWLTIL